MSGLFIKSIVQRSDGSASLTIGSVKYLLTWECSGLCFCHFVTSGEASAPLEWGGGRDGAGVRVGGRCLRGKEKE